MEVPTLRPMIGKPDTVQILSNKATRIPCFNIFAP